MALINCPECSKEISDKAEACPQCGFPIKRSPPKVQWLRMILVHKGGGYISFQCPNCHKHDFIMETLVSKTATGYKVNVERHCACGPAFNEIIGNEDYRDEQITDERIRCPKCGSMELSIQKEGFQAGPACCGAILAGPLGLLCGAKDSNKLNRHCLHCGHKWLVGQ